MNLIIIIAGLMGVFTSAGHIAIGRKMFLKPVLDSDCPDVPKKVFHALFHLITVNFVLLTFVLIIQGFNLNFGIDLNPVVFFAGISFILYAIVEIIIALTSGIPGALGKLFVWIFFLLTGSLALAGFFIN